MEQIEFEKQLELVISALPAAGYDPLAQLTVACKQVMLPLSQDKEMQETLFGILMRNNLLNM